MKIATFIVASVSLVVSSATLAVVLVGAKRAQTQIEEVRIKTNETLRKFKQALAGLEL